MISIKASKLIKNLQTLIKIHGDKDVFIVEKIDSKLFDKDIKEVRAITTYDGRFEIVIEF